MDSVPTLQNSVTAANPAAQGSVSAEISEAQAATQVLHKLIGELENRLSGITHELPSLEGALKAETPEPVRTFLAGEAHVVVADVYGAQARIRNLLDTLGL